MRRCLLIRAYHAAMPDCHAATRRLRVRQCRQRGVRYAYATIDVTIFVCLINSPIFLHY